MWGPGWVYVIAIGKDRWIFCGVQAGSMSLERTVGSGGGVQSGFISLVKTRRWSDAFGSGDQIGSMPLARTDGSSDRGWVYVNGKYMWILCEVQAGSMSLVGTRGLCVGSSLGRCH